VNDGLQKCLPEHADQGQCTGTQRSRLVREIPHDADVLVRAHLHHTISNGKLLSGFRGITWRQTHLLLFLSDRRVWDFHAVRGGSFTIVVHDSAGCGIVRPPETAVRDALGYVNPLVERVAVHFVVEALVLVVVRADAAVSADNAVRPAAHAT